MKKIAVVGAGPGGLAVAMLLAHKGYDVTIYEKQDYIGGRTSKIQLGDYKFDMGPTFLNMLYIAEEIFELTGRDIHEYVDLIDLNPMYQLIFHDKKLNMTRDADEMIRQINELFPGNEGGYERYMEQMSPWESPGTFSILSYIEHAYGVYHIKGGINKLTEAMAKVVTELGGKIHLGNGVKKLNVTGKKVTGLLLEDGQEIVADEVVINGDFAHVMSNLVEPGVLKKYTPEKLEKKQYSCSTFMLYLGVNKRFDLPHHTIWFAEDYRKNVEEITKIKLLSEDPSIYIQNAIVTDETVAPEGKSTLYILVPVPNNMSGIDWSKTAGPFRDMVLTMISEKLGVEDIRAYIEEERMISPAEWEKDIHVYKGATFNLGHQLSQMLVFRPRNKFEELDQCWLVGGGTHPGSGLPIILESARITANGMLQQDKQPLLPIKPLPKVEFYRAGRSQLEHQPAAIQMNV